MSTRRENSTRAALEKKGLYHSFRLPDGRRLDGAMSLEAQDERLTPFNLPESLHGKRVLDIGPWDGYYTFEMERRGAEVTAVDYVDMDTFRELHRLMGSKAKYHQLDVYELDPRTLGMFDIVLCFGVLYHLKHPLLALEKICAVTQDLCLLESFVVDGGTWKQGIHPPVPYIEFYEMDELGGQLDNWSGPTVGAMEALVRAAGFARADIMHVEDASAGIAARRRWTNLPQADRPPIEIFGLSCHLHRGRSFRSEKEEYIALWCIWPAPGAPLLDVVFPEIDGFGIAPLAASLTANGLLVSVRVPPGLTPGQHWVRLKIGRSGWSEPLKFYVDLAPIATDLTISSIHDGVTLLHGQVDWKEGGWITIWVAGLSVEADAGNTIVELAGVPHLPDMVDPVRGQINVRLRPVIRAGEVELIVLHRGSKSNASMLTVTGVAPPIRGLEV